MIRNTITVEARICWAEEGTYELSIGLQGEDLSTESVIEEVQATLTKWALSWLRQDCDISIRRRA